MKAENWFQLRVVGVTIIREPGFRPGFFYRNRGTPESPGIPGRFHCAVDGVLRRVSLAWLGGAWYGGPTMSRLLGTLTMMLCVAGCDPKVDGPPVEPGKKLEQVSASVPAVEVELAPAGELRAERAWIRFAIYAMPQGKRDLMSAANAIRKRDFPELKLAQRAEEVPPPSVLLVAPPIAEFAPPDSRFLQYFGRGLTPEQVQAVQRSPEAILMIFEAKRRELAAVHRSALKMAAKVAADTGGLIWDEDTRELFTPEAWSERISADVVDPVAIQAHFVIHSYREGELTRQVSLGMAKFGLPDIVAENVPASSTDSMLGLINLVAAAMVVSPTLVQPGKIILDLPKLGIGPVVGASSKVEVMLATAEPEEGDPDNRILAIVFPGSVESLHERQDALLTSINGSTDEVVEVTHNSEITAASKRAKVELLKLQPLFDKGAPDMESLLVKAPFEMRDGGHEWMWVEVTRWKGETIRGILQNDPFYVDGLKSGSRVEVQLGSVFDYIYNKADGSTVGNETGRLMQQQERAKAQRVGP